MIGMKFSVDGDKKIIAALKEMEAKIAKKILNDELRKLAKEAMAIIKPLMPVGKTKFLRRSLTIKKIKKKRRYTVGFRIVARVPNDHPYYAFAGEYGVTRVGGKRKSRQPFRGVPGRQAAKRFMARGIKQAEQLLPQALNRIGVRITKEGFKL